MAPYLPLLQKSPQIQIATKNPPPILEISATPAFCAAVVLLAWSSAAHPAVCSPGLRGCPQVGADGSRASAPLRCPGRVRALAWMGLLPLGRASSCRSVASAGAGWLLPLVPVTVVPLLDVALRRRCTDGMNSRCVSGEIPALTLCPSRPRRRSLVPFTLLGAWSERYTCSQLRRFRAKAQRRRRPWASFPFLKASQWNPVLLGRS